MYKILLADEEGVALNALYVMIDLAFGHECDVRRAANAQQLLEIFPKYQPDLLFINVQMAGIHGLSSIRNLHTQNEKCFFIVSSYNNKIDYGREGKLLNIYAYMPKPYRNEPIKKLLKECLSFIGSKQRQEKEMHYQKEQWDQVVPMLEHAMISEVLFPDRSHSNLPLYRSFMGVHEPYLWLCTLKFGQMTQHGTMCNPIGSVVQLAKQEVYFRTIVKAFFPTSVIGPILANYVVILVPWPRPELTSEEDNARRKRMASLTGQLQKKLDLRFRYGVSRIFTWNDGPEALTDTKEHFSN